MHTSILITAFLSLLSPPPLEGGSTAGPATDAWTQWRGPSRDGQFAGAAWPSDLETLEERWQIADLGPSYSGPIVTPDRVFTTATEDESEEVVRAYDRATGKELWEARWEGAMDVPFFAARNGSWIRSTPAYDGESLFIAGMRDVLVCLDADTGEVRWTVDFVAEFGTQLPSFGFVCSPLVVEDHVYVQAGASLAKLDKHSGEIVWRALTGQGGMESAFSSPVLATFDGQQQLVVQTRTDLCGVSLETGDVLWSTPVRAFRGMNILTPLVRGDGVFTAAYGGRSQLIRVNGGEEGFRAESDWDLNPQGHMTSPVLVDDHAYFFTRSNRFTCIDLESGEDRWTSPPPGDEYWSLVAQGDRILALANTGRLYLLRATPEEYEVLSELEIADEETWGHLAVVDGQLFVRSQTSLYAFDWK